MATVACGGWAWEGHEGLVEPVALPGKMGTCRSAGFPFMNSCPCGDYLGQGCSSECCLFRVGARLDPPCRRQQYSEVLGSHVGGPI